MKTIQTVIHAYSFLINTPEGRTAYTELCKRMALADIKCFESHGGSSHYMPTLADIKCFESHGGSSHYMPTLDGVSVDLELAHVHGNQWNTAPIGESETGRRVFDWAQDYMPNRNKNLKRGHWLEMTDAMRVVRIDTHKCGYCGYQCAVEHATPFCPECIGSEYLGIEQLSLTRMQSVACEAQRAPLSDAETVERVALYKAAHIHGKTERDKLRIATKRASIVIARDKALANANAEYDGQMWLMDHGVTASVIYYQSKGRFEFGWSRPVASILVPDLLAALDGFPFPFDIKSA